MKIGNSKYPQQQLLAADSLENLYFSTWLLHIWATLHDTVVKTCSM